MTKKPKYKITIERYPNVGWRVNIYHWMVYPAESVQKSHWAFSDYELCLTYLGARWKAYTIKVKYDTMNSKLHKEHTIYEQ
jgi:hypothetical protein